MSADMSADASADAPARINISSTILVQTTPTSINLRNSVNFMKKSDLIQSPYPYQV